MATQKMLGSEFRNVTIVHTEEDSSWCDYVVGKFKSDQLSLKVDTLNVTSLKSGNPSELRTAIDESYVVVLLTTCYLLEYMENHHEWLVPMLNIRGKNFTTLVVAKLNVTPEDLQGVTENYKCNQDKQWEIMEINVDCSNIKQCVTDILGFCDKNTQARERSLPTRTHSYPSKHGSSETWEKIEVIPNTVQQEGEKVVLIFTKEKVKGSVTLSYAEGINIPAETVNPYCVTFKAPVIKGTKIYINVCANQVKIDRVKLYRRSNSPQFSSVELMCQTYGVTKKEELDKKLADKFTSTMCVDSRAMMIFSDCFQNTSTGRRDSQYPTLLHWAAANKLRELCSALLSAPGANEACNISNCDDDDVADLAQKNGDIDLANFITEFTETKQMAETCDFYVKSYSPPSESDSLYEIMEITKHGRPTCPPVVPRTSPPVKLSSSSHLHSFSEDDENYITPDDFRLPTHQEFLSAKIQQVLPIGAIGSRSQTELIEIQEEVKKGNFSIREAEMLFSSWKARYETGNAISFKERKQSLQALREQHKKAMDMLTAAKKKKKEKGKKNIDEISELANVISEPIGMRMKNEAKVLRQLGKGDSGSSMDRANHDSGRYSGRDSSLSYTSTSSEEVEFEDDKQIMRGSRSQSEKTAGRATDYRQSVKDQFLELSLKSTELPEAGPPPLPPRLNRKPPADVKQPPKVASKPSFTNKPKLPVPSKNSTVFSK